MVFRVTDTSAMRREKQNSRVPKTRKTTQIKDKRTDRYDTNLLSKSYLA